MMSVRMSRARAHVVCLAQALRSRRNSGTCQPQLLRSRNDRCTSHSRAEREVAAGSGPDLCHTAEMSHTLIPDVLITVTTMANVAAVSHEAIVSGIASGAAVTATPVAATASITAAAEVATAATPVETAAATSATVRTTASARGSSAAAPATPARGGRRPSQ